MPRYAHIVSSLALVVALGGNAHAAGTQQCESVGVPQLRADAVRSALDLGVDTGWEGTSAAILRCTRP